MLPAKGGQQQQLPPSSAWQRLLLLVVGAVALTATAYLAGSSLSSRCLPETFGSSRQLHVNLSDPHARAAAGGGRIPPPDDLGESSGAAPAADAPRYAGNVSEHPACAFLRSGARNVAHEHGWGPYDQCDMNAPHDWLKRSRSNCYSCVSGANVCASPPLIRYHQYLEHLHPTLYEGNLLSMRVFLMTQDLRHAHMTVWVRNISAVVDNRTAPFFAAYKRYIDVRVFDYASLLPGTPFEGHPFFGNESTVKASMPHAGSYSDIVRILVLNRHGGFWMDNDVVLYQDLTHLLATSYQFVMRWMNLHVMFMLRGSPLMARALALAATMPLDHPDFKATIIEKLCKPNGYFQIFAQRYGYTDIYNGCLFRLLLRHNNTGPPGAVLYDMPLGWWDHDWKGCFNSRHNLSDTRWREVATHYLAQHNRYPGDARLGVEPHPEMTPLARVVRTVKAFFDVCPNRLDCLPLDGMSIMAYDGFDTGPPKARRRLLASLLSEQRDVARPQVARAELRRRWRRLQRPSSSARGLVS